MLSLLCVLLPCGLAMVPRPEPRQVRLRSTSTAKVYATMLIQITPDRMDPLLTTTIDGAEDSGPEDAPTYSATFTLTEESFSHRRSKSHSSMTSRTSGIPGSLLDEFIFTTTSRASAQSSIARRPAVPSLVLSVLVALLVSAMLA